MAQTEGNDRQRSKAVIARFLEHYDRPGLQRERSFRQVVETFYPVLHRFFERRGVRHEDAHDLTQETFVRIYRGMDSYRREAEFETWMFTVAGNVWRRDFRDGQALKRGGGRRPESLDSEREIRDPHQDPLDRAIREQDLDRLRRALETLPAKMQAVVKLSVYQERSRQEIALALGISPETVKAHLHQARKRLGEALRRQEQTIGSGKHD